MQAVRPKIGSYIEYGDEFEKGVTILTSNNLKYKLIQFNNGNLAIMRNKKIIWQNEMFFFTDYKVRVRINEKGHLIQEAQGIFTKATKEYRQFDWITVWSSAPINHNVTIGTPEYNGNNYMLVLKDTGCLNLYDAIGALIWCTDFDCQHRLIYK